MGPLGVSLFALMRPRSMRPRSLRGRLTELRNSRAKVMRHQLRERGCRLRCRNPLAAIAHCGESGDISLELPGSGSKMCVRLMQLGACHNSTALGAAPTCSGARGSMAVRQSCWRFEWTACCVASCVAPALASCTRHASTHCVRAVLTAAAPRAAPSSVPPRLGGSFSQSRSKRSAAAAFGGGCSEAATSVSRHRAAEMAAAAECAASP